jgi:hypothetical protein
VSNIWTDFVRLYALPGYEIASAEADWVVEQLVGDRGSYWVPVTVRLADGRGFVDIQNGGGKSVGIVDFWDDFGGQYDAMWVRADYGDGACDAIYCGDPNGESHRICAYGFDEVRVTPRSGVEADLPQVTGAQWRRSGERAWRLLTTGVYHCRNSRVDMDHHSGPDVRAGKRAWQVPWPVTGSGGLLTPTTPAYDDTSIAVVEPVQLRQLFEDDHLWPRGHPGIEVVECFWRGRLVHRVRYEDDEMERRPTWQHRAADWWDNCVDSAFIEFHTRRSGQM